MQRNASMPLRKLHRVVRHALPPALCIIALSLSAQTSPPSANLVGMEARNLGHQSWTTENGLPQNTVHSIFQSHDGYIWIATEGGIARFNGVDFRLFNHDNTPAIATDDTCCFTEADNALWIGTTDGLLQYFSGNFRRFTTVEGLPSNDILSLATNNVGDLYALTGNGLARFNGKSFEAISTAPLNAINDGANRTLWLATNTSALQLEQNHVTPLTLLLPRPNEPIQSLGVLPNRTPWLRTSATITFLSNGQPRILQASRDLPGTRIESFLADSHGSLWIGTNRGLISLDTPSAQPQLQPALGSNSILSLLEDREGNLWIGTDTAGLHIFRQQSFRTVPALADRVITAIAQSTDGALWAGTNGDGLDRWQNDSVRHFSTKDGLRSEIILSLAPGSHGDIWVGTPDGLNHISGSNIGTYTSADGLPDDLIRSLLMGSDGTLWIGTRRGLAHLHNNTFTTYTTADGLPSNTIGTLLQPRDSTHNSPRDSEDLWIATLNGLSRLRNGTIATFTTVNGLASNVITSLYQDQQGTLWIGTKTNGLSVYRDGHFSPIRSGELPQTVNSILGDNHGNLWLSSSRGITRVSQSRLLTCASSSICDLHANTYGRADGMPTEETSALGHPSAWRTTDGKLWFATRKGVAIADPANLPENRIPPPVVIEQFTVDDRELPTTQPVPPGHNRLVFQYAGLSYTSPSRIRYRYMLEGFDKQWTEAGNRRTAYYTNLSPGHYKFRVQAANNDGVWNEAGASLPFFIRPPFYRTFWFVLLVLAAATALGILLYRLRLRRLRAQFEAVLAERNRMAREIHDTLAQSFAGVSVQLELVSQLLAHTQPEAASQQLNRTRAYVREGLAEARRSIWDLRAITAQNTLPTRLTHLVEQSRTEPLNIRLNIGGTYRPIAPSVENEVLRIAQEALTNIERHASATEASINLRYNTYQLHLAIADNGSGFDPALCQNGHFGIQGMHERAAEINAQLNIASAPTQGTTITLDVPISTEKGPRQHG
jgi:signal transduction histidine kinase/ligand-binding sensor domain-containing protein